MEARVSELRLIVARDRSGRGSIRPTPRPGDAWDEYAAALLKLNQARAFSELRNKFETGLKEIKNGVPPDLAREALAPYGDVFVHLKRGAASIPGSRPAPIAAAGSPAPVGLSLNFLVSLSLWEARRLRESGSHDEAAELLVDLLIFAGDLARAGSWTEYGRAKEIWSRALDELKDLLLTRRISPGELKTLGPILLELERTLPSQSALMQRVLLSIGEAMCRDGGYVVSPGSDVPDPSSAPDQTNWRYGFSRRLTCATAFLWLDSWIQRLSDVDQLPWRDVRSLQTEFVRDLKSFPNGVARRLGSFWGVAPDLGYGIRIALTRQRLLGMVSTGLLSGSFPELPDPFGEKLQAAKTEKGFRVWSVGSDGIDKGGVGEWQHRRDQNIVVEVGN